MRLIGLNLTKMDLEKKSDDFKDMKLSTSIDISEVKEIKSEMFSKESLLLVKFEYVINYEKGIASLKFNGNIIVSLEEAKVKEVLGEWKNKKLPEAFRLSIFNIILKKVSVKALHFEEELNLPPHIPIPFFKPEKKKKD